MCYNRKYFAAFWRGHWGEPSDISHPILGHAALAVPGESSRRVPPDGSSPRGEHPPVRQQLWLAATTVALPIKVPLKIPGRRSGQRESGNLDQFLALYVHTHAYIQMLIYICAHLCSFGQVPYPSPLLVSKWRVILCSKHTLKPKDCVNTQEKSQYLHLHPITANSKKLQHGHTTETSHQPKGVISRTSPKGLLADIPWYFLLSLFILPYALHICWSPFQKGRLGVTPLTKHICSMPRVTWNPLRGARNLSPFWKQVISTMLNLSPPRK